MSISLKATGNIAPSRFVKMATTADMSVAQAGAGDKVIGISPPFTRRTPYSSLDDGYCAVSGEDVPVFTTNDECMLELGGTVTAFDRLKSDTDGKGVTTTTNLDEIGAIALVSGVSGQLIRVRVLAPIQISA